MQHISKLINKIKYFFTLEGVLYYQKQIGKTIKSIVKYYKKEEQMFSIDLFLILIFLIFTISLVFVVINELFILR